MKDQLTSAQIENKNRLMNNNTSVTLNNKLEAQNSKQLIRNWGFQMAANFNASLGGLRNSMDLIMSSYLSEIKKEEMPQHLDIKKEIEEVNNQATQKQNDIKLEKEKQAQLKDEMEQNKKEIEAIRIDSEGEYINSEFNWAKVILITVLTVVLGIALVLFYASLINNAIFADFGQRILDMNMDDLGLFNSIIDTQLLFTANAGTLISYFFSALFIALGILLHTDLFPHKLSNKIAKITILIFAFAVEVLFAYIIENNIYDLKLMTGLASEKPSFWSMIISKEVLTVLALGFVSYIVWSLLFEVSLREWQKRNPKKIAAIQIRELNRVINRRRHELGDLKKEVIQLENDINMLEERLKALKTKLEHIFFDKNEAIKRLIDFFNGWLQFTSCHSAYATNRGSYEAEFEQYKTELLEKYYI